MKAFVTGSEGFLGRYMVRALRGAGWRVEGADIARGSDCRHVFATGRSFDLVVHCAARIGGRKGIDGQAARIATYNSALDTAMFDWALRTRTRVVYFSSSAAYPAEAQSGPGALNEADINLDDLLPPESSYGWTKVWGEYLATQVRDAGVPVHVLRPFSGYGTDQDPDYPFPAFIARARAKADPFEVWGPGTQVRDFVHVDDICQTVLAVIDADVQEPVNVGTGIGTSFLDLADQVTTAAGYQPTIHCDPDQPIGVAYRVADTALSQTLWQPKITLAEGIDRAMAGVL